MTSTANKPRELDHAMQRRTRTYQEYIDLRILVANVIIAQMLPGGVIKGGMALKMRYGATGTRYTTDFDTARPGVMEKDEYVQGLEDALEDGWCGFSGALIEKPIRYYPRDVPTDYLASPYVVILRYGGKFWMEMPLELSHNEVQDADDCDLVISDDVIRLFDELGLPQPGPVPLMKLNYQVAQKLHAVSAQNSPRAHDLVDLQLIVAHSELDLAQVKATCLRVFAYRQRQPWPPTIVCGRNWDTMYQEASQGCDVLPMITEAVAWGNDLIARIDAA